MQPETHDLDELASACEVVDPTLKEVLNLARDQTVFAWEFCYPGEAEAPSLEEAGNSGPWLVRSTNPSWLVFPKKPIPNPFRRDISPDNPQPLLLNKRAGQQ